MIFNGKLELEPKARRISPSISASTVSQEFVIYVVRNYPSHPHTISGLEIGSIEGLAGFLQKPQYLKINNCQCSFTYDGVKRKMGDLGDPCSPGKTLSKYHIFQIRMYNKGYTRRRDRLTWISTSILEWLKEQERRHVLLPEYIFSLQ